MEKFVNDFVVYMEEKKQMAPNTVAAYRRDVNDFLRYLTSQNIPSPSQATNADFVGYILQMKNDGKSSSTINRRIASVRAFSEYLVKRNILEENFTNDVKIPKIERKEIDYLTIEEVDAILAAVDRNTPKGVRDNAILEVMYATGIRATELIELKLSNVNFRIGYITCTGEFGKARIIPLGRPSLAALEDYVVNVRPRIVEGSKGKGREPVAEEKEGMEGWKNVDEDVKQGETHVEEPTTLFRALKNDEYLFLNFYGGKLTRQGLWKIVKHYASEASIHKKLTPQILRNSFAIHMIQNGADLKSVQELMGYEDIMATQLYLQLTKNRIKDVYDKSHPRA